MELKFTLGFHYTHNQSHSLLCLPLILALCQYHMFRWKRINQFRIQICSVTCYQENNRNSITHTPCHGSGLYSIHWLEFLCNDVVSDFSHQIFWGCVTLDQQMFYWVWQIDHHVLLDAAKSPKNGRSSMWHSHYFWYFEWINTRKWCEFDSQLHWIRMCWSRQCSNITR